MKKIISIGDIHGSSYWKTNFSIEDGLVIIPEDVHRVIFVGDYVDSLFKSNLEIKNCLLDIIELKKRYPDKVILLIGNHDIQYIYPSFRIQYSGYRPEMLADLYEIFSNNRNLFKLAHTEKINKKSVLWTHAGVTNCWYEELKDTVNQENYRFYEIFKDIINSDKIEEVLNLAYESNISNIYFVDQDSGGYDENASPIWIRPKKLELDPLKGYDQVVGHTDMPKLTIRECKENKIFYIDTQNYGNQDILIYEID